MGYSPWGRKRVEHDRVMNIFTLLLMVTLCTWLLHLFSLFKCGTTDLAKLFCRISHILIFLSLFLIGGQLLYNVVLVSATQQRKSAVIIHICMYMTYMYVCMYEPPSPIRALFHFF